MKNIKTILRYILSTILAISMIIYIFINIASSTILSESYILSKLEQTYYYDKIYENVKSNFENYIYQSGLEESVIVDIVSKEKIEKDTKIIISNLYDGLNENIDTQEIKDNLNTNIKNSLGNNKLNITMQKAIDTFVEKICNEYTSTISHNEYEKQINNVYKKIMNYIGVAQKALLIVMGVCIILLLVISLRRIYKFFVNTGVALTISGAFLVIVNIYINMKVKIQTITILNNAISFTLRNILQDLLNNIVNYGSILLVSGIVLIIISNLIHYIRRYFISKKDELE